MALLQRQPTAALLGALAWLAAAASTPGGETAFQEPQMVHIGYGYTPREMTVHWTTIQASGQEGPVKEYDPGESFVAYGARPDALTEVARGMHFLFQDYGHEMRNYTMHIATMKGLQPNGVYYYIVGGNQSGWSMPFRFQAGPENEQEITSRLPMTYAVFGDQGDYNGQSIPSLQAEARKGTLDVVVHIGDMAYNLDSDNGRNGDSWMRDIEPLAATTPYMVSPGNHEGGQNFNHYTQRFRNMPSNSGNLTFPEFGNVPNNWWYSWDSGLVHWVTVSTELPFFFENETAVALLAAQEAFIRKDLAAVDRTKTPWVIVTGHRPLYCSSGRDCDTAATTNRMGIPDGRGSFIFGLEPLLHEFGVDMYLCGHEHSYERLFDVAPMWNPAEPWLSGNTTQSTVDPPATTYIVTGSAGNVELHSGFPRRGPAWSAVRMATYGWSRMQVFNATHLLWRQVQTDNGQPREMWGKVVDEFWLVQRHHGPFAQHPRRGAAAARGDAGAPEGHRTFDVRDEDGYAHPYASAQCQDRHDGRRMVCEDGSLAKEMERLGRWQHTKRIGLFAQQEQLLI